MTFRLWRCLYIVSTIETANNDNVSHPNSRPKLPFHGNGNLKLAMGREGKFEACIPGNNGKREFPLTPAHVFLSFLDLLIEM